MPSGDTKVLTNTSAVLYANSTAKYFFLCVRLHLDDIVLSACYFLPRFLQIEILSALNAFQR